MVAYLEEKYKIKVRRVWVFIIQRLGAFLLSFFVWGAIFPSILPPDEAARIGVEVEVYDSRIVWTLIVLIPLIFVLQYRYRKLQLAGWVLLWLLSTLVLAFN